MTIAVLWYHEKLNELWCATDSRITRGTVTTTDSGPKILPVPVVCYKHEGAARYSRSHSHSFGFAFAGSSLAAISTHALVTACTQNLAPATSKHPPTPPSLACVAELFRTIAQNYIADMSSRATGATNPEAFFFKAYIFGFCPVKKAFEGYIITPDTQGPRFIVRIGLIKIVPDDFHAIGSGADAFTALSEEMAQTNKSPGVIATLREMFKREEVPTVGGHFQIGVAHQSGFELRPILNFSEAQPQGTISFLGWNVDSLGALDGYRVGYMVFAPDKC